jgi:hypothetical protein
MVLSTAEVNPQSELHWRGALDVFTPGRDSVAMAKGNGNGAVDARRGGRKVEGQLLGTLSTMDVGWVLVLIELVSHCPSWYCGIFCLSAGRLASPPRCPYICCLEIRCLLDVTWGLCYEQAFHCGDVGSCIGIAGSPGGVGAPGARIATLSKGRPELLVNPSIDGFTQENVGNVLNIGRESIKFTPRARGRKDANLHVLRDEAVHPTGAGAKRVNGRWWGLGWRT